SSAPHPSGGTVRQISHGMLPLVGARAYLLLLAVAPGLMAQDSVAAGGRYSDVARTLTQFIQHERAQKGIPAISVALVDGQRVVWARGFGWADSAAGAPATAATVYRVGSVSKLFTDIGVMRLVERKT